MKRLILCSFVALAALLVQAGQPLPFAFVKGSVGGGSGGGGGPVVASVKYNAAGGSVTSSGMDTTGATLLIFGTASYLSENTPTDSKGNGYTLITPTGESTSMRVRFYYCANPIVGAGHTWTHTSTYGAVNIIVAFSGTTTAGLDQWAAASSTSVASLAAGSLTPTQAATTLIALGCWYNPGGTATVSDGLTVVQSFAGAGSYELVLAYKVLSSTSAINPTWSPGATQAEFEAITANFKN